MIELTEPFDQVDLLSKAVQCYKFHGKICIISGTSCWKGSNFLDIFHKLLTNQVHDVFLIESGESVTSVCDRFKTQFTVENFDCLVAVGGGRIIDAAKAISTGMNSLQLISSVKEKHRTERLVPLIAVPTTAGSGSEATPFAVVHLNGEKYSLSHPSLRPDLSVLFPEALHGLSKYQLAVSGLDAICQCIESLLSLKANTLSRRYARIGLLRGWKSLATLTQEPNPDSFAEMAQSAYLSGCAIAISHTTVPHAVFYDLTLSHNLPHGHAVALSMGRYLLRFGEMLISRRLF